VRGSSDEHKEVAAAAWGSACRAALLLGGAASARGAVRGRAREQDKWDRGRPASS